MIEEIELERQAYSLLDMLIDRAFRNMLPPGEIKEYIHQEVKYNCDYFWEELNRVGSEEMLFLYRSWSRLGKRLGGILAEERHLQDYSIRYSWEMANSYHFSEN